MQVRLKFDQAKIQAFFAEHTEKLVVGLVACAVLALGYYGFTTETYSKRPDELAAQTQSAQQLLNSATPGDNFAESEGFAADDYSQVVDQLTTPVAGEFALRPLKPLVVALGTKRGEASYLPAEKLQVNAGIGSISVTQRDGDAAPASGSREAAQGSRWVVLTAVVPYARQREVFQQAFADAELRATDRDLPDYLYFEVQRAEITSGAEPADDDWQDVDLEAAYAFADRWSKRSEEAVEATWLVDGLTFPLPPVVGGSWLGDTSVTAEGIPLRRTTQQRQEERAPTEEKKPASRAARPWDVATAAAAEAPAATETDDQAKERAAKDAQSPPYRLLRFFDFDVRTGHRYAYRVRLVLRNPNLGIESRFLESSELASEPLRRSDWSEASALVEIPRGGELLVGHYAPPRGPKEEFLSVILRQFVETQGLWAVKEYYLLRGQLARFDGLLEKDGKPHPRGEGTPPKAQDPTSKKIRQVADVMFDPGMALIDLRDLGDGECEAIFLDLNGRLVVRSTRDDAEKYDLARQILETAVDRELAAVPRPPNPPNDNKQLKEGMKPPADLLNTTGE